MSEETGFFRRAGDAIYLHGILVATLGMNPDTTTAKQVESRIRDLLAETDRKQMARVMADNDLLVSRVVVAENKVVELQDLIDNLNRGHAARVVELVREIEDLQAQIRAFREGSIVRNVT